MIDYEKLKTRFESLESLVNDLTWRMNAVCNQMSMNEMFAKPEPKYKVGWYLLYNHIRHTKFHDDDGYSMCDETNPECAGLILFPTRQALIEHQLQYWQSLYEPPEICEASQYVPDTQSNQSQLEDELEQHVSPYCEPNIPYCMSTDIQSNQSQVDIDRCQHEPNLHGFLASDPPTFSCIKCGEFYR